MAEITPSSVTQGHTHNNDEACCAAAHVIDRDLTTWAATDVANGAGWLKLQFKEPHLIHKIIVYWRFYSSPYFTTDWCVGLNGTVSRFIRCVNGETNVDVSVYKGEVKQKSCGTLQLTYGLEQSDQIYTLLCYTEGDTVKLSKDTGIIVVTEVVVIGAGKICKKYNDILNTYMLLWMGVLILVRILAR